MNNPNERKTGREPAKRPEEERRPNEDEADEAARHAIERGLVRIPPD